MKNNKTATILAIVALVIALGASIYATVLTISFTNAITKPTTAHSTEPSTKPTTAHSTEPSTKPTTAHSTEPTSTESTGTESTSTEPTIVPASEYDAPGWKDYLKTKAVNITELTRKEVVDKYRKEVEERIKEDEFFTDEEVDFFVRQGFTEVTTNGHPGWLRPEGDHRQMYYPIIAIGGYREEVGVLFIESDGGMWWASLEMHSYMYYGDPHSEGCVWDSEGYTPEQMARCDYHLVRNPEMELVFNGFQRKITLWKLGKIYARFNLPETYVYQDITEGEGEWLFSNGDGKIWAFEKLSDAQSYMNYSGGSYKD